jgi:hypothetical protein
MLVINFLFFQSIYIFANANADPNSLYKIFRPKETNDKLPFLSAKCNFTMKKLPESIIIGVKKSGTYALLRYLSINPQIKSALKINNCDLNEIHYFDQDENYYKGLDWYKSKMPNVCLNYHAYGRQIKYEDVMVMEKTPGYFRSLKAIERIQRYNPKTKIILIVRDPVKRIQSELTHCATRQKKLNIDQKCQNSNKLFEQLFSFNLSSSHLSQQLEENKFVRNSIYYLDMIKWVSAFGMKNIFVVNGENFIKTPWIELNKLEKFLNVTQFIRKRHFHFDINKNFFCLKESVMMPSSKMNESYFRASTSSLHGEFDGCLGKNKGRKNHVFLSRFVKNELKKYFVKWNKLFFKLVGQNFDW